MTVAINLTKGGNISLAKAAPRPQHWPCSVSAGTRAAPTGPSSTSTHRACC